MTDQSGQTTGVNPEDPSAAGPRPDQPSPTADFSGWDRDEWRAYRRAQKKAYHEAKRQARNHTWEAEYSAESSEREWQPHGEGDTLGALTWAAIFVWAGTVLLSYNLGWLDAWLAAVSQTRLAKFSLGVYSLVILGVGLILLLEAVVRLLVPALRRPVTGRLILAGVLIGVGLDGVIAWNIIWPVILIVLGFYIIFGGRIQHSG